MTRKIAATACVAACIAALFSIGLRAEQPFRRQDAPWWNDQWEYRLKVSVDVHYDAAGQRQWRAFDGDDPEPLTATIDLHRKNAESTASLKDIRVIDERGNIVPCRAYPLTTKPDTVTVRFPAPRAGGDFYIYYGSKNLQPPESDWLPPSRSLKLTTLEIPYQPVPLRKLEQIVDALRGNTKLHGVRWLNLLAENQNPTNLQNGNFRYITNVEGFLNCQMPGEYKFSVNSGGPGFLFIDDKLLATHGGTSRPHAIWPDPETIYLEKGYHHFRLILSEANSYQGIKLGWQPPWQARMQVIPADAFAKYIEARPRRFARRDRKEQVFFMLNESSVVLKLGRRSVVPVELINISSFNPDNGPVTYRWTIDGRTTEGFTTVEGMEAGKNHTVRLEAWRNGRRVGSLERECKPYAFTMAAADYRLETIGAPNIVYVGEQESLSFRIKSRTARAMALYWRYIVRKPGGRTVYDRKTGRIDATSSEEIALTIPLKTDVYDREAEVEVSISAAGDELAKSLFHVIPVGPRLQELKSAVGCLVNGDGRRAIISTHLIDETAFRKWWAPRLARSLIGTSTSSILLYGSAMENSACGTDEFVTYITDLRNECSQAARSFDFVKRTDDVAGILADLPRFASVIAARDPDVVVISPGTDDAMRGVPVRDFKRSLQVMLDLLRAKSSSIRAVLVSPPPLATNVKLSQAYRDGMAEVAERNRVTFVDIHTLLNGRNYLAHFASGRGDGVYYTYPNNDAQAAMADAIWKAIR